MKFLVRALSMLGAVALLTLTVVSPGEAESLVQPPAAIRRQAIVDVAESAARQQLDRPLALNVKSLNQKGDWAFLYAVMLGQDRKPLDLAGTRLAEAAREGMASRVFCALLRFRNAQWTIVASCLGVTDVAWTGWSRTYGAPAELFELHNID